MWNFIVSNPFGDLQKQIIHKKFGARGSFSSMNGFFLPMCVTYVAGVYVVYGNTENVQCVDTKYFFHLYFTAMKSIDFHLCVRRGYVSFRFPCCLLQKIL